MEIVSPREETKAMGNIPEASFVSKGTSHSNSKKLLIVDDESVVRQSLKKFCEEDGYNVTTASSGVKALKSLEETNPEIILLDINLPDTNGIELLKTIKEMKPEKTVIMITGHADVRGAIEAMKLGALDYLEKPLDLEKLKAVLDKTNVSDAEAELAIEDSSSDFIFVSEKMKEVVRIMERLATKSDVTVLVLGESGTGKSFICKKMHELSPRKNKPFVEIGCTNIPSHLIESELFGYEKGAFTDAKTSKKGLVEMAEGGTVFLDEIGDMPYQMQSKLLGLIEEKRFRRVGGLQQLMADVRIFAATNKNLHDLVQAKKFRLDLFYRLNVATIEIPPLRERAEDIPLLIRFYLNSFSKKYKCESKDISDRAIHFLMEYSWPGNVRELKNLVEKLTIISKCNTIDIDDIPPKFFVRDPGNIRTDSDVLPHRSLSLRAMEEEFIKTALKLAGGNQRKASKLLEISRDTLRYRLKKLKIDVEDFSSKDNSDSQ